MTVLFCFDLLRLPYHFCGFIKGELAFAAYSVFKVLTLRFWLKWKPRCMQTAQKSFLLVVILDGLHGYVQVANIAGMMSAGVMLNWSILIVINTCNIWIRLIISWNMVLVNASGETGNESVPSSEDRFQIFEDCYDVSLNFHLQLEHIGFFQIFPRI